MESGRDEVVGDARGLGSLGGEVLCLYLVRQATITHDKDEQQVRTAATTQ